MSIPEFCFRDLVMSDVSSKEEDFLLEEARELHYEMKDKK